ncbi:ABC transporter [Desulfofustis limnaeus]|uniref:ABC transporter n=1 Tax=Desulfofustis limnaeus TaxID=2740163 RepID=A0ABN6M8G4_9BACT|nr:ABC transporter [Desulfofustis limnaeus]
MVAIRPLPATTDGVGALLPVGEKYVSLARLSCVCLDNVVKQGAMKQQTSDSGRQDEDRIDTDHGIDIQHVVVEELSIAAFRAEKGQAWCILGGTRSGIDRFVSLLSGEEEVLQAGRLVLPEQLAVVSFRGQQALFEEEVRRDESDFLDRVDPGTPAHTFLQPGTRTDELVRTFRLGHVLDRGYRQLSSGESRKLLLLSAITRGAQYLVVENPYDGLDVKSCQDFDQIMAELLQQGFTLLLVLANRVDIPPWCNHLAVIDAGTMVRTGPRDEVLAALDQAESAGSWEHLLNGEQALPETAPEVLVRMVAGHARYGEREIFSGLDFQVDRSQHTLITGPNGAGKSTLLAVISGDHPDCYTNELYLFGIRRGSGESIWQLKRQMGIVSPALHREHYLPGSALQVIVSGFFDSIGLYSKPTHQQQRQARAWLAEIGLSDREKMPFRRLGYGEQRLILIARALIKLPKLLVLDEPTHGLDDRYRASLLDFLETIAARQISTILYVSHRRDEYRPFFRQHVELG